MPAEERDEDATARRAAVAPLGVVSAGERHELLITHNFVIGWFVRHVPDAPDWRWIGLNLDNCAITSDSSAKAVRPRAEAFGGARFLRPFRPVRPQRAGPIHLLQHSSRTAS